MKLSKLEQLRVEFLKHFAISPLEWVREYDYALDTQEVVENVSATGDDFDMVARCAPAMRQSYWKVVRVTTPIGLKASYIAQVLQKIADWNLKFDGHPQIIPPSDFIDLENQDLDRLHRRAPAMLLGAYGQLRPIKITGPRRYRR